MCGGKRKLTPEHEALVIGSIAELRERGGASDGEGRNSPCLKSNCPDCQTIVEQKGVLLVLKTR